ncbi:hypothetical protein JCM8547_008833 [Rhodosporidiobolus lusitaniae]
MPSSRALQELVSSEFSFPPPHAPFTPLLPPTDAARRNRTHDAPLPALELRDSSSFRPGWRVDSYVVPAAFPRVQRNGTRKAGTPSPVAHRSVDRREKVDLEEVMLDTLGTQIETLRQPVLEVEAEREALEEQEQLHVALNRYVPLKEKREEDGRKGVSLVFCHGTGLCKEIWEPVLRPMLDELEKGGDVKVDEIFALDTVNQGDSAVLNEKLMGKGSNWVDLARDLLNFLLVYVNSPSFSSPSSSLSPTLLKSGSFSPSSLTLDSLSPPPPGAPLPSLRTHAGKTLVGIGHSLGGSVVALAATAQPSVFSCLILIDPWLITEDYGGSTTQSPAFRSVALRRDRWKSREEAEGALGGKGLFRAFDKEVTEVFMKYGLREFEDGTCGLKTSAAIERLLYSNPFGWQGPYLYRRLLSLDPSLPIHIFLPHHKQSIIPEDQLPKVIEGLQWVTFERLKKAHHLAPQFEPERVGKVLAKKLRETYGRPAETSSKL